MVIYRYRNLKIGEEMSYYHYCLNRDAAWDIHLDLDITRLPVNMFEVCDKLGIIVRSYSQMISVIPEIEKKLKQEVHAYTRYVNSLPAIFYNEQKDIDMIHTMLAHELGHLVAGHISGGCNKTGNSLAEIYKNRPYSSHEEEQADQFAMRLLAPACVLWGVGVKKPEDIKQIAGLPMFEAEKRAKRMRVLYKREQKFLSEGKNSCFLMSDKESMLFSRYINFINECKSPF